MIDIVYIETSIVSHATARPSGDIQMAALQQQAREWWATHGPRFELVTSQLVLDEASAGDPGAAVAGVQYLLTLNCSNIANARELPRIYRLLDERGFGQLLICTPAEFLGGNDDQESDPR